MVTLRDPVWVVVRVAAAELNAQTLQRQLEFSSVDSRRLATIAIDAHAYVSSRSVHCIGPAEVLWSSVKTYASEFLNSRLKGEV